MRDKLWLRNQLEDLLKKYFSDVRVINPIEIKFGREAKYRFGSIKLIRTKSTRGTKGIKGLLNIKGKPQKSIITITSMFAKEEVPEEVVRYTIAHELTHYAHGFSSANKRLFKHPHHGGIVNKELAQRGARALIVDFKQWLKNYRKQILSGKREI